MPITDAFVLAKDVTLVEVTSLPPEIRRRIEGAPGDRVLTRSRVRAWSKLVGADSAALLDAFQSPTTIPAAVLGFALSRGLDPERTLDDAYPLLQRLVNGRILVSSTGGDDGAPVAATFDAGDEIDGFTVVALVSLLEDTEVYQVRGEGGAFGAFKIARAGHAGRMRPLFANEVRAYQALDGRVTPACLGSGEIDGCAYLVTSWCAGARADAAAADARRAEDTGALLALCVAVADAYAHLHDQGLVHGDVHPGNVLVKATGGVELIDLGYAGPASPEGGPHPGRAGVPFYFEPEHARAILAGGAPPPATPEGEQYAVAALLYELCTGAHYLDFSLQQRKGLLQIAEDAPLPFAAQGVRPWPALEAVLERALSKSPGSRFASMRRFAEALSALVPPLPHAGACAVGAADPLSGLLDRFLARVSPGGERYEQGVVDAPRASIALGAAGIAYALYRIAIAREEAELLALADVWTARARRAAGGDGAFYAPALDLLPEKVGDASLHHTASGLHYVQALVSLAMGDRPSAHAAARELDAAARDPGRELDVTFGRSGLLLAEASLLELCPDLPFAARGAELLASLWSALSALGPVGLSPEVPLLGAAHGWAGFLHATLRWCTVTGSALPPGAALRLSQIVALGEPWGRGVRFRRSLSPGHAPEYWAGWCGGSTGMIHLFLSAHAALGDERFLELAERSAWAAWEQRPPSADLCCGLGGQAYGLLALYQATGSRAWLSRARALAGDAAIGIRERALVRDSLYRGEPGIAVLAAEMDRPELAAMPLFAAEGGAPGPAR